jgi:hypothetical protein
MRQVRTRHRAACDLSEGLALVCPRCRDAWYSPSLSSSGSPRPLSPSRRRLARLSLDVLMLAGIALLVLALADAGTLRRPPPARRPPLGPRCYRSLRPRRRRDRLSGRP